MPSPQRPRTCVFASVLIALAVDAVLVVVAVATVPALVELVLAVRFDTFALALIVPVLPGMRFDSAPTVSVPLRMLVVGSVHAHSFPVRGGLHLLRWPHTPLFVHPVTFDVVIAPRWVRTPGPCNHTRSPLHNRGLLPSRSTLYFV